MNKFKLINLILCLLFFFVYGCNNQDPIKENYDKNCKLIKASIEESIQLLEAKKCFDFLNEHCSPTDMPVYTSEQTKNIKQCKSDDVASLLDVLKVIKNAKPSFNNSYTLATFDLSGAGLYKNEIRMLFYDSKWLFLNNSL